MRIINFAKRNAVSCFNNFSNKKNASAFPLTTKESNLFHIFIFTDIIAQ